MESLEKLFYNPPAHYRGKPFWSWNGKLEKKELLKQIDNFKAMGMGGYFCHSRVGLITEYLGKEWFELINACADKGAETGMETWLYDEDRWPSGTAGGMVTQNSEFRMKYLRLSILDGDEFSYDKNCVAAFTVKLDGFSFTEKKRLREGDSAKGCKVLQFTVEEMGKENFYNGYTYVNTMSREATNQFIELTHKKYEKFCGDQLGHTIYGIFTDEPHRGSVMNGFGLTNQHAEYLTPYVEQLFQTFSEKFQFDLVENLPELFLWKDGEKFSPVKWDYMELIEEMFLENYMKPLHQWCVKNGMKFTGHLLHEDTPTAQACMIGSIMRGYEYMDCPGVDVLGEHNYNFWIVKQITSAARQLGKKDILSELYGCTGWQFSFEGHKAVGDWQALLGVNLRCHHLSWYEMQGTAKRDYPASISGQSAWFRQYKYIEDYFSRIHVLMGEGEPVCDILIVNPIESTWSLIYPGWANHLGTVDPDVARIEKIYYDTFHTLCEEKLDFDYGDEDYIARFGCVREVNGTTVLQIGRMLYRSVLITGLLTIRSSTLRLLREFAQRGGNVVVSGEAPQYVDAVRSNEACGLPVKFIGSGRAELVDSLKVEPFATVQGSYGENIPDIYAQVRKKGDEYIIFLLNINRQRAYRNCVVRLNAGGYCEQWNARTGDIRLLTKGQKTEFAYDFEPDGELLLRLTPADHGYPQADGKRQTVCVIPPDPVFSYRLSEPNVCTLNFVDYKVNSEQWVPHRDILQADDEIRGKFGMPLRGGEMLQPWFAAKQEHEKVCDLELRYRFHIAEIPDKLQVAVEASENFRIMVNHHKALEKTEEFWVDKCFCILNIDPSVLKTGMNEIILSTDFRDCINLEAVYLLGDFGVTLNDTEPMLTGMPRYLCPGDLVGQGLPFYGAGVSYHVNVPELKPGYRLYLESDPFSAACIRITDGKNERIVAAHPYRADITELAKDSNSVEVEYILTRRNTFEPLHPEPNFTGKYDLIPSGMTGSIRLTVEKPVDAD